MSGHSQWRQESWANRAMPKAHIFETVLLLVVVAGAAIVPLLAQQGKSQSPSVGQLEITRNWQLCLPPSSHKALARAAVDLQGFLRLQHGLELDIVEGACRSGITLAVSRQQQEDGFSLRAVPVERQILVGGSSPRAVYQGVLLLEDYLAERPSVPGSLARTVVFPFKDRYLIWDALLTGQNKGAIGFDLERHVREAVRLGYSGLACNRFVGMTLVQQGHPRDPYPWYTYWGPSMDQFVASPLFDGVFPKDYLARNLADLKYVVKVVESFGMKPIFMGYEPRFVPESFLQQHPDLRGPRVDHPLRSMTPRYSLCTDQPQVLEHYRILARRLAEEVPALSEMHIIFHDSGAGFCWEDGGYSGRNGPAHCKNVPMGERMRSFFLAIRQGFRDAGADIALVAQPHGSSRREIDGFFDSVPREIDFTAGNWPSWSLVYQDPLEVDRHVLARQRETGRRTLYYQQHFFGFDVAPTSEFPLLHFLAERLGRARELGLDVLSTLGGIVSPPIKERSAMQEVYRQFLLEPGIASAELLDRVARNLGGPQGGEALLAAWEDIRDAVESNRRDLGFGLGTEYASRRTLVRPLVPDPSGLLPEERDWWQAHTFGGDLRFGHAHLFRGEGGLPSEGWYRSNHELCVRAAGAFRHASVRLQSFLRDHPESAHKHPYLPACERQFRFLSYVYSTGANLYEGQRILDKYSRKSIEDGLRSEVAADVERFHNVTMDDIENTQALLRFIEEGGDIGMVLLPEETTWGYSTNLPELLRRKIKIMRWHLPEIKEVLTRWFDSEY